MGIRFLSDEPAPDRRRSAADDVVILPAFGVTMDMLRRLDAAAARMVDTTCGSVLNVWKNVRRYAENGYTVDHPRQGVARRDAGHRLAGGRVRRPLPGGVRRSGDRRRSATTSGPGGDRDAFLARFRNAVSPGFDPDRDLQRIGVANQTTMLMSESLRIADTLKGGDGRSLRRRAAGRSLSVVRHHLQRDAGPAGRGADAAAAQRRST